MRLFLNLSNHRGGSFLTKNHPCKTNEPSSFLDSKNVLGQRDLEKKRSRFNSDMRVTFEIVEINRVLFEEEF